MCTVFPTDFAPGNTRSFHFLSSAPQAEGFSVGLSPAPQAAGFSAGLSLAPQAEPVASLFQSECVNAIIHYLLLISGLHCPVKSIKDYCILNNKYALIY
jgi:hypothetical protein